MEFLNETVDMMNSENYQDRFIAEYWQTKIRYDKLDNIIVKIDAGTLDFEPKCNPDVLREQWSAMNHYLYCLKVRAEQEGISL